jgi:hypothetical protein
MQKRGQFFLIAAVIISILIIGVGTVYITSISNPEESFIYDLSDEIDYEASQVIDSGVLENKQHQDIFNDIKELTTSYAKINPNEDLAVYYGNAIDGVSVITYTVKDQGSVGFNFGGSEVDLGLKGRDILEGTASPINGEVEVSFGEPPNQFSQTFKLTEGQNFFIVVKKERGDERTVAAD